MLNYVGDYEGNKQKIQYSYIVQDHFMVCSLLYINFLLFP